MRKNKKDTILIYTDAINMAVYRGLEYSELGELMLALFEYNNGKEKNESDFSSENLYDLYDEYKEKVDDNYKKYKNKKARNERYQAKKKAENADNTEEPDDITCCNIKECITEKPDDGMNTTYYHKDKRINDLIEDNIGTIDTGETRYMIIQELKKNGNSLDDSINIYNDIINNLN